MISITISKAKENLETKPFSVKTYAFHIFRIPNLNIFKFRNKISRNANKKSISNSTLKYQNFKEDTKEISLNDQLFSRQKVAKVNFILSFIYIKLTKYLDTWF